MKRRELILASSSLLLAGCGGGASKDQTEKSANQATPAPKPPHLILREQVQGMKKLLAGTPPPQEITAPQAVIEGQVLAGFLICTHQSAFTKLQTDASKDPSGPFKDIPDPVYNSLKTEVNKPNNQFAFAIQAFADAMRILSSAANSPSGSDDTTIYPDPSNPESCLSLATLYNLQHKGLLS